MNNPVEAFGFATAIVLMIIGLIFTIVPPLPGTVIIWGTAVFYGLILGWDAYLGWATFIILTILMVVGLIADFLAGHVGARVGGASWLAIILGFILGIILAILANFVAPILGCLVGLFGGLLGIVISIVGVEYWRNRDWDKAKLAIKGYCAGHVLGALAKFTISVMMIAIFVIRVFFIN